MMEKWRDITYCNLYAIGVGEVKEGQITMIDKKIIFE